METKQRLFGVWVNDKPKLNIYMKYINYIDKLYN